MSNIKNVQTNPELATIALGKVPVTYTRHAQDAAKERRINLAKYVNVLAGSVVELEINPANGKTTKLVVRQQYNNHYDVVLVLIPASFGIVVKTVWLNHVNDNHNTLNLNRLSA